MKRIFLLLLCLLLVAGCLLSLTACNSKTETDPKENTSETDIGETTDPKEDTSEVDTEEDFDDPDNYYCVWDDLSTIKRSDAAYLLDPDFTVTAENFSDCIHDYFSAPAMLYFNTQAFSHTRRKIKNPEKAEAFADVFQDLSITEISSETYSAAEKAVDENKDAYCSFSSAIGHIHLFSQQGNTYIFFSRESSGTPIMSRFCVEGDLLPELNEIAASLEEYSERAGTFELAENFG